MIRAHHSLDHLNKHSSDDILVISNIRHPVAKFYSEFYHHRQAGGKLVWAKHLGDDIDYYIDRPEKLKRWSQHYIHTLTNLIEQVHVIILLENIQHGLYLLGNIGYDIEPPPEPKNICPEPVRENYDYRLNDVEQILKPAINLYQQFKESYLNH